MSLQGYKPNVPQTSIVKFFDDRASEEYGIVRANLERMGTTIGPNGTLIAAIR